MADPRQQAAAGAGPRAPRWARGLGWSLSVILWAVASDARPLLAILSVLASVLIRTVYLIVTNPGPSRSIVWSPWFFALAAVCELAWLVGSSPRP